MRKANRRIVFFDLDYTILPHDTLFLLGNFVLRKSPWRIYYLLFLLPAFGLFLAGAIGPHGLKRAFLSILAGIKKDDLERLVDEFSNSLVRLAFPDIIEEIQRYKKEKAYLVLNTASPQFYIEPLGKKLGFDHCVGSGFQLESPMPLWLVPTTPNNKHLAKLKHMEEILPTESLAAAQENWQKGDCGKPVKESHAYTDSVADLPLLAIAEHKHVVCPGGRLRKLAEASGWQVHELPLPYKTKWGKILLSLRQMFGLFRVD